MQTPASGPSCYLDAGSPPSSYAIAAVLEGEPGGWTKVILGTSQRSFFILPGLALAGVRGQQLFLGALLGSCSITAALFGFYALRRKNVIRKWEVGA